MKRIRVFFIISVVATFLFARENPFVPLVDTQQLPITSSDPTVKEDLKEFEFSLPSGAMIVDSIVVNFQDASGEVKNQTYGVDKKINWHYPLYLSHSPKKHFETKEYQPLDFVKIVHEGTTITIYTTDKMIRNFHLINPFKLVFDFENGESFFTKREQMDKPVVEYAVGNHGGYYRVVLEFDATYRYEVQDMPNGVKVELK